jgi:predicted transcriptional regulator
MPSTSIHLPDDLLEALNRLAAEEQVPRNRIIVEAIREAVRRRDRRWPDGYFSGSHLGKRDLEDLRSAGEELERRILDGRRTRSRSPF